MRKLKEVKIAIVGSELKEWTIHGRMMAIKKIYDIIDDHVEMDNMLGLHYEHITVISGGCPKGGVDIWTEAVVYSLMCQTSDQGPSMIIHVPQVNRWNDMNGMIGYKSRNMKIAEDCDKLYLIDPSDREWSGGRWTYNYAKKIGKEVYDIKIPNNK